MRASYKDIAGLVRNLTPFNGNSMSATMNGRNEYWIFSYSTPIAVINFEENIFKLNARKYSSTSSRHQNIVRKAFPQLVEVSGPSEL